MYKWAVSDSILVRHRATSEKSTDNVTCASTNIRLTLSRRLTWAADVAHLSGSAYDLATFIRLFDSGYDFREPFSFRFGPLDSRITQKPQRIFHNILGCRHCWLLQLQRPYVHTTRGVVFCYPLNTQK